MGANLKYYFSDVGLRNARLNFRQQEPTHIMENKLIPMREDATDLHFNEEMFDALISIE